MATPANEYSPTHAKEAQTARALCSSACARPNALADTTIYKGHELSAKAACQPIEGGDGENDPASPIDE